MPFSRGRRIAAAAPLVFTLVVTACASKDKEIDPFSVEKMEKKAPPNTNAPKVDPDALSRAAAALASAEQAWISGDPVSTLAIVNRALVEGPPEEMQGPLRDLRAKARTAVVASKIASVRAIPEKDVVAAGASVPLRIEFKNLSTSTLRAPRAQKGTSDAVVILTLLRTDFDVFGNERSTRYTLRVPIARDIELAPGATLETKYVMPASMTQLDQEGFSVIELSGSFRPVTLRVGDTEFFDAIPLVPAKVRVFMAGFEPLAADPLGSLKKAVAKRSPPHLMTAAELLAPSDRSAARAFLLDAKAADPPLAPSIDAALKRLASAGD